MIKGNKGKKVSWCINNIRRIVPWLFVSLVALAAVVTVERSRDSKLRRAADEKAISFQPQPAASSAESAEDTEDESRKKLLQNVGAALVEAMGLAARTRSSSQLEAIRDALQASAANFQHPSALPAELAKESEDAVHAYTDCRDRRECATQILYHLTNGLERERRGRHPWHGNRERIFDRMFMSDMLVKYQHRLGTGVKCLEWSPLFYTNTGQIFGEKCTEKWSFDFSARGDPLTAVLKQGGGGGSIKGDICSKESTVAIPPDLEGTFDFVLMTDVLEHLPDPFVALSVVSRLLKPGGLLLKTVPWVTMTHNKFHFWGSNVKGLLEVLERSGLEVEKLRRCGVSASVVQYLYGLNADFFNDRALFSCSEETPEQVKGRGYKEIYLQAQAVAVKPS